MGNYRIQFVDLVKNGWLVFGFLLMVSGVVNSLAGLMGVPIPDHIGGTAFGLIVTSQILVGTLLFSAAIATRRNSSAWAIITLESFSWFFGGIGFCVVLVFTVYWLQQFFSKDVFVIGRTAAGLLVTCGLTYGFMFSGWIFGQFRRTKNTGHL